MRRISGRSSAGRLNTTRRLQGRSSGKLRRQHRQRAFGLLRNRRAHPSESMAAAGSDARMNGCELPVVINAGSGNQGMTCSLPVLEYAKERKATEEETTGAGAVQPDCHPPEDRNRPTLRILRCGECRSGSGCGNRLPLRWRLQGSNSHRGQCAGHRVRYHL